jgi:hypothetical protein
MKQFIIFFSFIILVFSPLFADVVFNDYFKDKTMRLDYFHTGNFQEEHFAVDRVLSDGIWSGSKTVLLDRLNLGPYQFEVKDPATGKILYSRGFASIFGEWQTIGEAKKVWKTCHESIRFPWPLKPVKITMKKRDKKNEFQTIWETGIDPAARTSNPADLKHTHKTFAIIENGPADKKLDIVVLGDGYAQKEMPKFREDCRRLIGILMNTEPYKSRKTDFNVWGVETPSEISGVSRPHPGIFKRTPLSVEFSIFDSERYALSYDNRTIRDTASAVPYDFMVILMNERTYGGGGIYRLYGTVSADNQFSDYIIVHELGHHIAGLGDEYYTSSVSYEMDPHVTVEPWELNITALLDKDNLKWKHLVSKKTPIPTPWGKQQFEAFGHKIRKERQRLRKAKADEKELEALFTTQRKTEQQMFKKMKYRDKVGAFEGAMYMQKGLYRSSVDCIMFTRSLAFCPVCRNALNLVFDQYTR